MYDFQGITKDTVATDISVVLTPKAVKKFNDPENLKADTLYRVHREFSDGSVEIITKNNLIQYLTKHDYKLSV